ncbi:AraC family transcriptional regulator [Sulfurospirillum sp. MES]|uniref:helix-turn-helix transcriptional regulator n=1 Tax=Sulfurospirillum sp. MES TaxID=1565314 RepID=UPI000AFF0A34|nr:AraC family transcriptional regulator [Sulfurospirillum sp. MES]
MAISLSSHDFKELVPALFSPTSPRTIGDAYILKEFGNVHLKYFNTGHGIAYAAFDGVFNEELHLHSWEMQEQSFLYFNAGDAVHFKSLTDGLDFNMQSKSIIQGTIHEGLKSLGIYEKSKRYSSHTVVIDPALFHSLSQEKLLDNPPPCNDVFFQIDHYHKMLQSQYALLNHISTQTPFQGSLQELYLESKLLELVYQTFHNSSFHVCTEFCQDDCKAMHKAKNILLGDLANPPSLKALARQCALNEFKLKQGFKKLFGTTVYGFVHTKRLEKAKELLEKQEISVQEAALHVGYQSLSHFSKAFKERYGKFPLELKKERKYYLFPSPCMDRGE